MAALPTATAQSSYYGFEYFSGANVLIRIGDMPLLEATGIAFALQESKRPIYSYHSRHFDAVASGQVLVQGQLIINYVHQDYLYKAIQLGLNIINSSSASPQIKTPNDVLVLPEDYMNLLGSGQIDEGQMINQLRNTWWNFDEGGSRKIYSSTNPHDNYSGLNVCITFGEQDLTTPFSGKTGCVLNSLHFTGRSQQIQISEDVIVESYPFFARNIVSINQRSA